MRRVAPLLCALVLPLLMGCNPKHFDDFKSQAPVVEVKAPGGFDRVGFGSVVTAYTTSLPGGLVASRVASSAGAGTPFALYDTWDQDGFGGFARLFIGCKPDDAVCPASSGAALAGIPSYGAEQSCVAVGAPNAGRVAFACETSPDTVVSVGTGNGLFGAALAANDAPGAKAVLFVGAPENNAGEVYAVTGTPSDPPILLPLPTGDIANGGEVGAALAVAPMADGSAVLAVGAPGAGRVLEEAMDAGWVLDAAIARSEIGRASCRERV